MNCKYSSDFIVETAMKAYEIGGMGDAVAAAFALVNAGQTPERNRMKHAEMHELLLKSGGPAFPGTIQNDDKSHYSFLGMTIRDHFAAQVISSMTQESDDFAHVARRAYQIADAMIEARRADWNKNL